MKISEIFENKIRKWLVSPFGPTIIPLSLLIVAFLFPPLIYEHYVEEKDYMFLNFQILGFGLICTFSYYFGVVISNSIKFPLIKSEKSLLRKNNVSINFNYINLIAILTILLQVIFILIFEIYFYRVVGIKIKDYILLMNANLVKIYVYSLDIPFGLGAIPSFVFGLEFLMFYLLYYSENKINSKEYKILKFNVTFSAFLFILTSVITVNSNNLATFLFGWFVIYLTFKRKNVVIKLFQLFLTIIVLFAVVSILRWGFSSESLTDIVISKLLSYTIANYNRFALMLDGKLSYVETGIPKIFFIFPIQKIPFTNLIFHDFGEYSRKSLWAVGRVGLNPLYNAATLYGGIYQSVGFLGLIYFAFLGFIGSKLYQSFKYSGTFGIIMYPLFFASVALWTFDVNFFVMRFPYFFSTFLFITIFNLIFKVHLG